MARKKKISEMRKVIVTDVEYRGISLKSNKPYYQVKMIDVDTAEQFITYPDQSMRNYRSNWKHICESDNPYGIYYANMYLKDLDPVNGCRIVDGDSELELDFLIDEQDMWSVVDLVRQYPVKPQTNNLIEFV